MQEDVDKTEKDHRIFAKVSRRTGNPLYKKLHQTKNKLMVKEKQERISSKQLSRDTKKLFNQRFTGIQ